MGRERGHNLEYEWRFVAEEQGLGYWIGILRASIRGKGNSAKSRLRDEEFEHIPGVGIFVKLTKILAETNWKSLTKVRSRRVFVAGHQRCVRYLGTLDSMLFNFLNPGDCYVLFTGRETEACSRPIQQISGF